MPRSPAQIDKASFGQQKDGVSVVESIAINLRFDSDLSSDQI
jgi:hypothetical protein